MSENQNSGGENFGTGGESSPFLTVAVALLLAAHFARASLPDVDISRWPSIKLPVITYPHATIPSMLR
jgi:hypothetical protein